LRDDDLQRKVLTTSRKIKNSIDKAQVLGDMNIPIVSDVYNTVQSAVNDGDRVLNKGMRAKSKIIQDFDDTTNEYNNTGSGINNQYMPTKKKTGGSFRVLGGNYVGNDSSTMLSTQSPSMHPLHLKTYH
jgi:hypothetical protein